MKVEAARVGASFRGLVIEVLGSYHYGYTEVGKVAVVIKDRAKRKKKPKAKGGDDVIKPVKDKLNYEWRYTFCPKHGRMPTGGRWECCGE